MGWLPPGLQFRFYDYEEGRKMAAACKWEEDINVTNVVQKNIKEIRKRERFHDISTAIANRLHAL